MDHLIYAPETKRKNKKEKLIYINGTVKKAPL